MLEYVAKYCSRWLSLVLTQSSCSSPSQLQMRSSEPALTTRKFALCPMMMIVS